MPTCDSSAIRSCRPIASSCPTGAPGRRTRAHVAAVRVRRGDDQPAGRCGIPPGSGSAWSVPAGSARCSGRALRAAGHAVVGAVRGVRGQPGAGRRRCCPASRCWRCRTCVERRRAGAAHRAGRRAADLVAGPGRDRRLAGRPAGRAHLRPVRLAGAGARRSRPRRDPARAAPGDDLHRHQPGPGPAGRLLLRGDGARPGAADRRRRWSSRWAPSRWWSPRRPGRSTTRRSRTARTTWSRWSRRRWSCCARPGSSRRTGCSAPLLSAALDNALRSGDAALTGPVARGDAGTVAAHLRRRSPAAGRRPRRCWRDLPGAGPRHRRPRAGRRPAAPGRRAEALLAVLGRRSRPSTTAGASGRP